MYKQIILNNLRKILCMDVGIQFLKMKLNCQNLDKLNKIKLSSIWQNCLNTISKNTMYLIFHSHLGIFLDPESKFKVIMKLTFISTKLFKHHGISTERKILYLNAFYRFKAKKKKIDK